MHVGYRQVEQVLKVVESSSAEYADSISNPCKIIEHSDLVHPRDLMLYIGSLST